MPAEFSSRPVATAVHLIIEFFRVAKIAGANVGLDTQIIAMRSQDSYAPFTMPSRQYTGMQSEFGVIQENLKSAIWGAFSRSSAPDPMFDMAVQNIGNMLKLIKSHTIEQGENENRFIRYSLSPTTGEWSMAYLDLNIEQPT
jgi:hypothetical protein